MQGYVARIFTSFIDVPDKISLAIFFSGCSIRCKGCHNKELWNVKSGSLMSEEEVLEKIKANPLVDYVAFMGGEPTDQMKFLIQLCKRIKKEFNLPVAMYTGREFEILPEDLINNLDLIICGPYKKELHVGGWPASSNQRIFRKRGEQWQC
ncbi:4Fe-4S cluster-binding domain-containing protein [Candidatus Dependentiae bacterium]|nr:4Fe-4S cluster-binding domain-containing protein [Candidatus Dependentiae bacterium]